MLSSQLFTRAQRTLVLLAALIALLLCAVVLTTPTEAALPEPTTTYPTPTLNEYRLGVPNNANGNPNPAHAARFFCRDMGHQDSYVRFDTVSGSSSMIWWKNGWQTSTWTSGELIINLECLNDDDGGGTYAPPSLKGYSLAIPDNAPGNPNPDHSARFFCREMGHDDSFVSYVTEDYETEDDLLPMIYWKNGWQSRYAASGTVIVELVCD